MSGVSRVGNKITNTSAVAQVVTLRQGDRWHRTLLEPGESRTLPDGIGPEAEMSSSTDTSSMRGKVTIIGGKSAREGAT